MASEDPRYAEVNALHAQGYPAVTQREAGKCAQAIMRHFGKLEDACALRTVPMWKRTTLQTLGPQGARRCWSSTKPTRGLDHGWGRLAHDMAHRVYRYRHPSQRPHGPGEAAIELAVAQFVRAWIDAQAVKPPPAKVDTRQRTLDGIARWERKLARAQHALTKLRRRLYSQDRRARLLAAKGAIGEFPSQRDPR